MVLEKSQQGCTLNLLLNKLLLFRLMKSLRCLVQTICKNIKQKFQFKGKIRFKCHHRITIHSINKKWHLFKLLSPAPLSNLSINLLLNNQISPNTVNL
jgi:hypothetical protein